MVHLTALCVEQFAGSLANSVDSLNYSVVPERATKWYLTVRYGMNSWTRVIQYLLLARSAPDPCISSSAGRKGS